ncbi:MAG TPA: biotin/lipoyl-binding protein [Terriglobia bacterium]|nr:biotin/lipoyl-binding protein [Terriglobia bacterium]
MRTAKLLSVLALLGIFAGGVAAHLFSVVQSPQPPLFNPPTNPYARGIYAEGIVESTQASGKNINLYPEVPGTVNQVFVTEGQSVHRGSPLLLIDDSVQSGTTEQLKWQAQAALSLLEELRAEPRKESLDVAGAQVVAAEAALKVAGDALDKQQTAFSMDPKSVSKDALDNALNAAAVTKANLAVANKQYDLAKAGAWIYDVRNQERQYHALLKSYQSSRALLSKYTLRAPGDGIVLSINTTVGSYISPQGAYDSYTQGSDPVLVLGTPQSSLDVRCYVDEILVPRLPPGPGMKAQMSIRGTNIKVPLNYVRVQPYVSPKVELSDQRSERVDVRVLPVIFRFDRPMGVNLYPGELVDVFIGE